MQSSIQRQSGSGDTRVTLQYRRSMLLKLAGNMGESLISGCFCQGMKSISLQTSSNLLTTLGTKGLANTSDLKVPLPFLCKQRELRSTSSGVHIGTDKKAGRPRLLKDPSQVEIVPTGPMAPCLSNRTILSSPP